MRDGLEVELAEQRVGPWPTRPGGHQRGDDAAIGLFHRVVQGFVVVRVGTGRQQALHQCDAARAGYRTVEHGQRALREGRVDEAGVGIGPSGQQLARCGAQCGLLRVVERCQRRERHQRQRRHLPGWQRTPRVDTVRVALHQPQRGVAQPWAQAQQCQRLRRPRCGVAPAQREHQHTFCKGVVVQRQRTPVLDLFQQLRPTGKAELARQHELRLRQAWRWGQRIGHGARQRAGLAAAPGAQQLTRLAAQLIGVGVVGQRRARAHGAVVHRNLHAMRLRSARSGRTGVGTTDGCVDRWAQPFPRIRRRPARAVATMLPCAGQPGKTAPKAPQQPCGRHGWWPSAASSQACCNNTPCGPATRPAARHHA